MPVLALPRPPSPSTSKLPLSSRQAQTISQSTNNDQVQVGKAAPAPSPARRNIASSISLDVSSVENQTQAGKRVISPAGEDEEDDEGNGAQGQDHEDEEGERSMVISGDETVAEQRSEEEEEGLPVLHSASRRLSSGMFDDELTRNATALLCFQLKFDCYPRQKYASTWSRESCIPT